MRMRVPARQFDRCALSRHTAEGRPGARHFDSMEALQTALRAALPGVASVLVKGSRFMRMERAVQTLNEAAQPQQAESSINVAGAAC